MLVAHGAAAEEHARFLFQLNGVPVGVVELHVDEVKQRYRYTSTEVFTRGTQTSRRVRSDTYAIEGADRIPGTDRVWESLWLWRGPWKARCVTAESELERQIGRACINKVGAGRLEGSIFGEPFTATTQQDRIVTLDIGTARFSKMAEGATLSKAPPDLFGKGWKIGGSKDGTLAVVGADGRELAAPQASQLEPWKDVGAAKALAGRVHDALANGEDTCLEFARRFVKDAHALKQDVAVVHGLIVEKGATRALPHAWVRVNAGGATLDLDPTLMIPVTAKTHLPLAVAQTGVIPGRAWLDLVEGKLRVVRK